MNFLKRWLEKRRAEKERIARCEEGRRQSDALVEMLMAGRKPVGDDEWFRNLEADIFHEECGDR
jgi:hypothetical protein